MKKFLLLILTMLCVVPAFAASEDAKAVETTKAFVEAMRIHDYSAMVDLLPPPIVKAQGGKEKIVAALNAAKVASEVEVLSASFDSDPQKIEATDAIIYFVKADLLSLYKKQTRIVAHTYYVSFRFKDQKSWSVFDGSKYGEAQLRKLFRGLPEPLAVPKVFAEVVKEEPISERSAAPERAAGRGLNKPGNE